MQTLHLETAWFVSWYRYNCLLSFEDPVLKHSWQPSCAIHMPFINIIKYLFHYSNFHTIRPLPHRLQSTWNRILNETDNATWSLGHLELWGIFLFNTLMLFYLSCSTDENWFLWPTAHLNAVMLLSSSCFQFSTCNQTLSPTQAKTRRLFKFWDPYTGYSGFQPLQIVNTGTLSMDKLNVVLLGLGVVWGGDWVIVRH